MDLPVDISQNRLIKAVAMANRQTIVVNATGAAIDVMDWLEDVPGFMQVWFAGQETGNAIVDVLLGEINPSGRLPISWPRRIEHTACYGNFGMDCFRTETVHYAEDVHVGYRHFDDHYSTKKEVLFPFGYGLSYTTFGFSTARLEGRIQPDCESLAIEVAVTNLGDCPGGEVVQVYVQAPLSANVSRPVKELVGFEKIFLKARESGRVLIPLANTTGAYWDEKVNKWRPEPGTYTFRVPTSSHPRDLRLALQATVRDGFVVDP